MRLGRGLIAWIVLQLLATAAFAQDYTAAQAVTVVFETRPTGATKLPLTTEKPNDLTVIDLPFEFPYWGRAVRSFRVNANGFLLPGSTGTMINAANNGSNHGHDATSGAFPYTPNGVGGSSDVDGIITPMWDAYSHLETGVSGAGAVYLWTVGTAPNRRVVISWEDAWINSSSVTNATTQVHLYEGSGRIVFAYSNSAAGFAKARYVLGIDSPGDARFLAPYGNSRSLTSMPPALVFDPKSVTYSGRLLYDQPVNSAGGLGTSTLTGRPLGGLPLELRRDSGILVATGTTASDGTFSIVARGVATTSTGSLHVLASNAACRVLSAGVAPAVHEWAARSTIDYSASTNYGDIALTSSNDPNGTSRGPLHVARLAAAAHAYAAALTTDTIERLDITLDDTNAFSTQYVPKIGVSAASMAVGGRLSPNPDAFDDGVVTKVYGRHVLASIAPATTATYDDRADAVSGTQNAFAEAFGAAIAARVLGATKISDGLTANTGRVLDLETPVLTVTRSDSVAGAAAAALYDTIDGVGEATDAVDGTGSPDRFLTVTDGMSVTPAISTFIEAWAQAGHDAVALTRTFVGNGVVADDAAEPNDSAAEATDLGAVGVRRGGLTLNRYGEDWVRFTLPQAVSSVVADVTFSRSTFPAVVGVQITTAAGSVLATGAPVGTNGSFRVTSGALPAGSYRVRVAHESGVAVPAYDVQVFVPMAIPQTPLVPWTAGQAYDTTLGVTGGVPPYSYSVGSAGLPAGLGVSTSLGHVVGTPTTAGDYPVQITARDSGSPQNVVSASQTIRINPPLSFSSAPLVGFTVGSTLDTTLPLTGGTAPIVRSLAAGSAPAGVTLDPSTFRIAGSAPAPGFSDVDVEASDVSGDATAATLRLVACGPASAKAAVIDLAAGDASAGVWVDAVEGSSLRIAVKTAPKKAKRALSLVVAAPDRSEITGIRVKAPLGGVSAASVPCAKSGRYYVFVSSDAGDATQLLASVVVSPPRTGKGVTAAVAPGSDPVEITFGALAGAKLSFKASTPKRSPSQATFVALVGPDGVALTQGIVVKTTSTGFSVSATLPSSGTWTMFYRVQPPDEGPADVAHQFTLKQPARGTYLAE